RGVGNFRALLPGMAGTLVGRLHVLLLLLALGLGWVGLSRVALAVPLDVVIAGIATAPDWHQTEVVEESVASIFYPAIRRSILLGAGQLHARPCCRSAVSEPRTA